MKRYWPYLLFAVLLAAVAAYVLTYRNPRWWVKRIAAKWGYELYAMDGEAMMDRLTGTPITWRVAALIERPISHLKHMYLTGDLPNTPDT